MHNKELIFQKIDNPELIKVAKTLKNDGIIVQEKNYTYLKISDDFIHKLYRHRQVKRDVNLSIERLKGMIYRIAVTIYQ
ncbi:MAG: hypothetical protein RCO49_06680 [Rickettsia endosymbiont of Argas persicus]